MVGGMFLGNRDAQQVFDDGQPRQALFARAFLSLVPKLRMLPFLRPGYCRVRRNNQAEPKAEQCFYLSGGTRRPADSLKVIMSSGAITYTRDLTWEHPRAPFPFVPAESSRHMSAPEEGGAV